MQCGNCWRVAVLALALAGAACRSPAETIRVGGTGSATPLIQQLSELYRRSHPDIQITLIRPPLGSRGGMHAVAAGRLDLAISATPPDSDDAPKLAPPLPWLTTPLVLAGRDVPPGFNLSRQQLADIYAGRMTQWPDGQPIRLVLRPGRDADSLLLRRLSPLLDAAVAQALRRNVLPIAQEDLDNLQLLERTPGSLGTVALGHLLVSASPLTPIAIDGIWPSSQSVRDGSYPLSRTLLLLTARNPGHATRAFVDFLRAAATARFVQRWEFRPAAP